MQWLLHKWRHSVRGVGVNCRQYLENKYFKACQMEGGGVKLSRIAWRHWGRTTKRQLLFNCPHLILSCPCECKIVSLPRKKNESFWKICPHVRRPSPTSLACKSLILQVIRYFHYFLFTFIWLFFICQFVKTFCWFFSL